MEVEPWLARAARRHPEREALRTVEGSLTYAELLDAASGAAAALAAGERVGLALDPGRDLAIALHACLLAGAVAVPVDPRLGERERAAVLSACTRVLDALPAPDRGGARAQPRPHDLDAPAIVVHTSGTSGAPKAVELTYGNWLWSGLGAHVAMGLRPDERWLCALPLSHVGGLSILVRSAIYATCAIVHPRFDVDDALAALRADATLVSLVPTTLSRLLDAGLENPPALRCALIGGAPIPSALLARARDAGVPGVDTYGLTEACSQVTTGGRPLFCTRVRLGEDSEVEVAGPTIAPGAGPWLATGDLGHWTDDGRLEISGRKADTIVTGGENVAPAEVEAVLASHPAVAEAAVHGVSDTEWGEAVAATIVLHEGSRATPAQLRDHCRARLAPFQVPKSYTFAASLPKTSSGKLLRRLLTHTPVPPENPCPPASA